MTCAVCSRTCKNTFILHNQEFTKEKCVSCKNNWQFCLPIYWKVTKRSIKCNLKKLFKIFDIFYMRNTNYTRPLVARLHVFEPLKCSMQCALCSMQYTVRSIHFAVCIMQFAVCSMQCSVCIMQCVVCSVQYAVCSVQYAVCTLSVDRRFITMQFFRWPRFWAIKDCQYWDNLLWLIQY